MNLRTRLITTLIAVPAVAIALTACGSDTDDTTAADTAPESTVAPSEQDGAGPEAGTETPTAEPSNGQSDTPSPSDDGAQPNTGNEPTDQGSAPATFTSFEAPTTATCMAVPPEGQEQKPPIVVTWSSANAVEAWYSPSAQDAKDDAYLQIPLSGSQADFGAESLYPCFHDQSHSYTITLVGADGAHVSKTWTVTAEEIYNGED